MARCHLGVQWIEAGIITLGRIWTFLERHVKGRKRAFGGMEECLKGATKRGTSFTRRGQHVVISIPNGRFRCQESTRTNLWLRA